MKPRRVLYCRACGCSQVVDTFLPSPCGECGQVVFNAVRHIPWHPFRVGRQSATDAAFLRTLRIATARSEALGGGVFGRIIT